MPPESVTAPGQPGLGRAVRVVVVLAAVSQLVVAIVLALRQAPDPGTVQAVSAVTSAEPAATAPAPTTTTLPPLVVEATVPTTAPPPESPAVVATGAVFGVIGAGPGGTATAFLRDEAGNTWHSTTDGHGAYRFDRLPPGRYQLILSAESASAPCPPGEACIGTATAISKRVIEIGPGSEVQEDFPVYGPTGPAPMPVTTTTPPTTTPQPAPTTTTTVPTSD